MHLPSELIEQLAQIVEMLIRIGANNHRLFQGFETQAHRCHVLAALIVQLSRNAPSFFFLNANQSTKQVDVGSLGLPSLINFIFQFRLFIQQSRCRLTRQSVGRMHRFAENNARDSHRNVQDHPHLRFDPIDLDRPARIEKEVGGRHEPQDQSHHRRPNTPVPRRQDNREHEGDEGVVFAKDRIKCLSRQNRCHRRNNGQTIAQGLTTIAGSIHAMAHRGNSEHGSDVGIDVRHNDFKSCQQNTTRPKCHPSACHQIPDTRRHEPRHGTVPASDEIAILSNNEFVDILAVSRPFISEVLRAGSRTVYQD
jgi:hypothetical protein